MTYSSRMFFILIALITFVIAACSDSDSSSETSASADGTTVDGTTTDGAAAGSPFANATIVTKRTRTNLVTVQFTSTAAASKALRNKASFATIHWGDNTTNRLSSDNNSASHVYLFEGVYPVRIVLDSGEVIRLGDVTITASCNTVSTRNTTISGCP